MIGIFLGALDHAVMLSCCHAVMLSCCHAVMLLAKKVFKTSRIQPELLTHLRQNDMTQTCLSLGLWPYNLQPMHPLEMENYMTPNK
jgi:hypothetical protein